MESKEIQKIVHYCWFGRNPLPKSAQNCIASWKKYFPEYEIKEWNEDNFSIECCKYVREAYNAKKWAFVSDYARFWILYNFGGLYFDTDVEVIKSFDDILAKGSFMGCEAGDYGNDVANPGLGLAAAPGLGLAAAPGLGLAAAPGLGLYKEILDYYNECHFDLEHIETVVDHTTKILRRHGFEGKGEIELVEDIYIYPPEYFCPMNQWNGKLTITDNTHSIHHYTATWQSSYSRFKAKLQKILGKKATDKIISIKRNLKGKP